MRHGVAVWGLELGRLAECEERKGNALRVAHHEMRRKGQVVLVNVGRDTHRLKEWKKATPKIATQKHGRLDLSGYEITVCREEKKKRTESSLR